MIDPLNKNNIRVGDTICVEQAWEDRGGMYRDARAKVLKITKLG